MIRVNDRVQAKQGSGLETMLIGLGVSTVGTVKLMGQAGDCEVLFDGTPMSSTVALQDLESLMAASNSGSGPFKIDFDFDDLWPKRKKERKCDCGAEKAKTTHAFWCTLNDEDTEPNGDPGEHTGL